MVKSMNHVPVIEYELLHVKGLHLRTPPQSLALFWGDE